MKPILIFLFTTQLMAFDHTHAKFDQVLKTHVKPGPISTLFEYKKLKANNPNFNVYLSELEAVSQEEFDKFSNDQKLSFWINAYNAYTIKLILDHYPVKSIKEIKPSGFFSAFSSPWKIKFIKLLGKELTLDNIEHDIIRKNFDEPRIHFAVNCASMGCPSLRNEAFIANKLESQLQDGALKFITNKKKNRIDHDEKKLYLSQIFKWYGDDFKKKHGSFLKYFAKTHPTTANLEGYEIEWNDYGWDLNE